MYFAKKQYKWCVMNYDIRRTEIYEVKIIIYKKTRKVILKKMDRLKKDLGQIFSIR